ncbi:hypothetical protein B188_12750 [Candidatus Brocadiaceae bacterium B188]|nr:DUF2249 domain-containing protein [Candidatus Brocadia sapporoensis]MEB2309598.1 DUF2249 domain-containing protein [Candidatus Brocadiaceae bacterium]QQR66350.1 MAG: DUF2249 domain-containing protein [Candidatus Brocadia sp.]RZV58668.1 MAG: DUF2249 domain-containing protein [Candidatus Brocadia sp. BROELEC01]TWU53310.1 hypothetical protein B188_12750 [Candidatus Brocadiaceae bacterium B188]
MSKTPSVVLDVRSIVPRERHSKIFNTFDGLKKDEMMVLINDHDPKPLKYQLDAERSGQLDWKYIEQGPEVWKVEITKK